MRLLGWRAGLALALSVLRPAGAVTPGQAAPDLTLRDCRGAEVRLSGYRHKNPVVVLAPAPGGAPAAAALEEACRRLAALDTVALVLAPGAEGRPALLGEAQSATVLVDSTGVVRRVLPGRVLTGADLVGFADVWLAGKAVFDSVCARCHGPDGDSNICLDVKPLKGLGRRLSESEIRDRLRPGVVNDREMIIRGQIFTRQEVDAVIVYIAGL
jgi:cytochrome c553